LDQRDRPGRLVRWDRQGQLEQPVLLDRAGRLGSQAARGRRGPSDLLVVPETLDFLAALVIPVQPGLLVKPDLPDQLGRLAIRG
jgi:hypothetical protein